jgi:aromatic ring-opening dioxygenase catalytic subunit (LigB family)
MAETPPERERRLIRWADAPGARLAHPREEHLLPLMVATGAADDDRAELAYAGTMAGLQHSAFHFGAG